VLIRSSWPYQHPSEIEVEVMLMFTKLRGKATRIYLLLILAIVMALVLILLPKAAYAADSSVSTFSELQAAVSSAPTDGTLYTIEVTANMDCTERVLIPDGANIKIVSDNDGPWTLTSVPTPWAARHFRIEGSLTLESIILDGQTTGGGIDMFNGELTMNDGAVITRGGPWSNGSGIYMTDNSVFTMNGGEISYCRFLESCWQWRWHLYVIQYCRDEWRLYSS